MDLRHFRYVQQIAEERSFSRAAEKLYIAQPALSQYILNLERELGTKLFDRSKNPISITYTGELFLQKAKMIIEIEDELHNEIRNSIQSDKGRLIIAISPNRGSYFLPKVLPAFSQVYPNVEIKLQEGLTNSYADLLTKDMADVAILAGPIDDERLDNVPIQKEDIMLAVAPGHRLVEYAQDNGDDYPLISLGLFKDEQFIISRPGQGLRIMADELFESAGFKPKIYLETQSFETAHRLALSGLGVAVSASTLGPTNLRDPLKYLKPLEKSFSRTIVIAYKKRKTIPWTIREFVNISKEIMQAYCVSNENDKAE